jgi:hypothetical protein
MSAAPKIVESLAKRRAHRDYVAWRRAVALMVNIYGLRAQFEHVDESDWATYHERGMEPIDAVIAQEFALSPVHP